MAKIESGELSLDEGTADPRAEVVSVIRMMGPRARSAQVRLENTVPSDVRLRCDVRRLRQVLLNLASNAVKFSKPGGVVAFGLRAEPDGAATLLVQDDGVGMSPDELAVAMEPFGQVADGVGNNEGTGLGLPLSRYLAETHGGRLWLESNKGEGTTVHVQFPASRVITDQSS